ncbi:MAG: cyclic nucleotide-binding domain-containing protein [Desulfotalea sp.]
MSVPRAKVSPLVRESVRRLDLFSDLLDDEIDILVKHAKFVNLDVDDYLFHEGDPGDFFAIIIDGRIEIEKYSEKGTPILLTELTSNNTIGEMSVIDQETRSASAIATELTTIFTLSKVSFDTLVAENPECGVKLIKKIAVLLSKTVRSASERYTALSEKF